MKRIILIALAVTCMTQDIKSQNSLYISPGISISWDGDNNFLFGWKLSLGYIYSEQWYYNITFGKFTTLSEQDKYAPKDYMYLELQRGDFFGFYPLSAGLGLGARFTSEEINPRLTMFGGALLFVNLHYTFSRNKFGLSSDLSLPIPFNKELRDLDPG